MTISFIVLALAGAVGLAIVVLLLGLVAVVVVRGVSARPGGAGLSAAQTEAAVSFIAALIVMFSAMLNPLLSVGLAILFLLGAAVYKLLPQRRIN